MDQWNVIMQSIIKPGEKVMVKTSDNIIYKGVVYRVSDSFLTLTVACDVYCTTEIYIPYHSIVYLKPFHGAV